MPLLGPFSSAGDLDPVAVIQFVSSVVAFVIFFRAARKDLAGKEVENSNVYAISLALICARGAALLSGLLAEIIMKGFQ